MGKGFAKQKKQARALQEQMSQMQAQMESTEVEGSAGNGLVTLKMSGKYEIKGIKIKPECVDPDDIEGLEDLIAAAHKDAFAKLEEQGPQAGMPGLPGMF